MSFYSYARKHPLEVFYKFTLCKYKFYLEFIFWIGRWCRKVVPEPVSHHFWAPALTKNVLSIFFSRWHLVNDSRKKILSASLLYIIGFETINFISSSWKRVVFDQTYTFKNRELLIITKIADLFLYSKLTWNSMQNFKADKEGVLVLALWDDDNLWFLLIFFPVHH